MTASIVYERSRKERHILPDFDGLWIFNHSNGDERRMWDGHRSGQLWERLAEMSARS